MRALILSDIHSNLEALKSVIESAGKGSGFDQVWQFGDLVGYGPDPSECIDIIRDYDAAGVAGNHDLAAIGKLSVEAFNAYASMAALWTTEQLSQEQTKYLGSLPLKVELEDFTIVHGSPRDPVWEYVVTPAAAAASFLHLNTSRCFVGHSHIPFLCRPQGDGAVFLEFPLDTPIPLGSGPLIINPGSVGQPRDGDPRASYAIYDSEQMTVYHHRAEYDIPKVQEKMQDRGLPKFLADRLTDGR